MAKIKTKRSTRSGLFLIELIVAILFFSIACAICIQLFVKADLVSKESSDLTMALNQVQSTSEAFKATKTGHLTELKEIIGGENGDNPNEITLKYDSKWKLIASNETEAEYVVTVSISGTNPVVATIKAAKATDMKKPIYEVEAKKYSPYI